MTSAALRAAIEAVLGEVPFTPPLEVAYCQAVFDALHARVPGTVSDVYQRGRDFVVEARLGDVSCVYVIPLG